MSEHKKQSLFSVIQQFYAGQIRLVVLVFTMLVCACNSPYIPKQEGYFKIPLPEKKYITFNEPSYPYTFEYPDYAHIVKDTTFFDSIPENPYWINIDFPQFAGRIYMSYKSIGKYKLE